MIAIRPPLYRQSAIDKQAEPEAFDQLLQVTTMKSWMLLGAAGSLLLAITLWGLFGKLTVVAERPALIASAETTDAEVVAYLHLSEGEQVRVGMAAQVFPYGQDDAAYLAGSVRSVEPVLASDLDLSEPSLTAGLLDQDFIYEVSIDLEQNIDSSYVWAGEPPSFFIESGTRCLVRIVLREEHPISRVIPGLS
ncbi:MAG: hypothetical protein H7175_20120 [Burkholderiales bacterium]|nr:hypothetical protein [Anaerolineae bacterium]